MNQLFTSDGLKIEPKAKLPQGDLKLKDGRILKFMGPAPIPDNAFHWKTQNGLRVLAAVEETQHGWLLHVSMSYGNRDPSWDDIKAVRDAFYPDDCDAMMLLPKSADYVNFHVHTFHLWQTPVAWDIL